MNWDILYNIVVGLGGLLWYGVIGTTMIDYWFFRRDRIPGKNKVDKHYCPCQLCQHVETLSYKAIEDFKDNVLEEIRDTSDK